MFNNKNEPSKSNISTKSPSQLDTLVGNNTKIQGDIKFSGVLSLDGTISGSLTGANKEDVLTISKTGTVEGKIEVANIIINGTVKGDIIASGKVEVASNANIEGNVYYRIIEMDSGSKINGQLIYQDAEKANKIAKIDSKKNK
ncbi:MAG TPA: polymer-forming cytoskeletal protein [Oceanospirillales bacterium]|nr:polymer-forming cytoskeletal protein [Oceanospirillales bacterium]